jgi:hypothetical protein
MAKSAATDTETTDKTDAPKKGSKAEAQTAPQEPAVTLATFLRLSGERPDQVAGFAHYAPSALPGRRSLTEWQDALTAFSQRPIR